MIIDIEDLVERNCGNCRFGNVSIQLKEPNVACSLWNENHKESYCCYLHEFKEEL